MRDVIIACDFKNKEELFDFLKDFEGLKEISEYFNV